MRLIAKLVGSVFALLLFVVLLQGVASETGEVVVLTSVDQSTSARNNNALMGGGSRRRDVAARRRRLGMDPARPRAIHASGLGARWHPL